MVDSSNPSTRAEPGSPAVPAAAAALAAGRLMIGGSLILAPERTLGALGFEQPSETTVAVARLAGVRDIVLGAAQALAIGDRDRLRRSSLACAAADAGDAAVFASALGGEPSVRRAAMRGAAAATPAALAGLWLASRLR